MKALYFYEHGGIEKLQFGDLDDPRPKADEVLVQVHACALNHLDLWVLRGWKGLVLEMPHIGGADVAGTIVELGAQVKSWKIGDRVVVNPGIVTTEDEWTSRGDDSLSPGYQILGEERRGGFAELVAVPAANLHSLPTDISFESGAAALLVGVTAWRMLRSRAQLQPGQTVLIVGAGGGLNSFAIQLAKSMGAKVIALTSSTEKMKRAQAAGAEHVVNYLETPEWSREVKNLTGGRGADVVIDNVGAKSTQQSLHAVCRGGKIITVGNTSGPKLDLDNRMIFSKQISYIGSTMGSRKDFIEMLQWIWGKKISPIIDSTFSLEQGVTAIEKLARGEQFGKILLLPPLSPNG